MHSKTAHFIRHYAEMVAAMLLGMFVLGGAATVALAPLGVDVGSWHDDAPALMLAGMAVTMTVPMVGWMRYRGHGWTPCSEMAASMIVPTLATIALLAAGTVEDGGTLMAIQHMVMFPAMLLVMLLRPAEDTRHHREALA
jgi:hypothetical protein